MPTVSLHSKTLLSSLNNCWARLYVSYLSCLVVDPKLLLTIQFTNTVTTLNLTVLVKIELLLLSLATPKTQIPQDSAPVPFLVLILDNLLDLLAKEMKILVTLLIIIFYLFIGNTLRGISGLAVLALFFLNPRAAMVVMVMIGLSSAHNWINSLSRSNGASTYQPFKPATTDMPHAQVGPNQKFQIEWMTAHGGYT
jgi:hypothetical protein